MRSERQEIHNPAQINLQHQILLYPLSLPQHSVMQAAEQEVKESTASLALLAWVVKHLVGPSSTSLYQDFPGGMLGDCLFYLAFLSLSESTFIRMHESEQNITAEQIPPLGMDFQL